MLVLRLAMTPVQFAFLRRGRRSAAHPLLRGRHHRL